MASGNPFRASQAINQSSKVFKSSDSSASASSKSSAFAPAFINTDTDSSVPETRRGDSDYVLEDTQAPPTKTKKSVRIVSPTTTIPPHPDFDDDEDVILNELMARRSSQSAPASPPPPVNPAGFANSTITAGEANAQMLGRDVMATPEILPSPSPYFDRPQATLSPSNVPSNPFSRTLASLEPQERESGEERTRAQGPTPGNHRASLDVESFKNLLLTGKPTPRPSGQPPQTANVHHPVSGAHFESSSSTDTSSISRQSLFEPPQETHAESPRTSVDMADSDEDESMGLMSEVKKGKKKPPPAPKHRHGKLVAQRQPQTVSFASFAAATSTPPAIRRTDSSDMNKPLPPTPSVAPQPLHISTQDTTSLQSPPIPPSRRSESSTASEGSARQKRAPPPVPLARRQSQLRTTTTTTGNRSRSSSNLTINSQHSVDALTSPIPHNQDPISGAKSPPPPPPSRHGARLAHLSNPSANSSSTELPQRSSSVRTARSIPDPPSSRRSTMDSENPSSPAPGVNRTSSISSNRKVSGGSTGSQMPPPPPPPRRKRESLDQQRPYIPSSSPTESRRTSTEYNTRSSTEYTRRSSTEHRRTSVASESSLRREYAPVNEQGERGDEYALYSPNEVGEKRLGMEEGREGARSDSSNILDDMEKFQREIDELRLRTGQVG